MSMNHKKAVAVRTRQREALTTRPADNDEKLIKKTTPAPAAQPTPRRRAPITLAPVSICRRDE